MTARCALRYISRSWGIAEIWIFEIIQDGGAILNLFESKIAPLDPPSPKTPLYNQTWRGSDDRLRRYGHLKFFQDGGGRHLGFVRTGNSAIRSAVPENPTLEQNMPWIGRPVAEISSWNVERWNYFRRIPIYVITIHQRHRQTDRQTDDMRSQYRALH